MPGSQWRNSTWLAQEIASSKLCRRWRASRYLWPNGECTPPQPSFTREQRITIGPNTTANSAVQRFLNWLIPCRLKNHFARYSCPRRPFLGCLETPRLPISRDRKTRVSGTEGHVKVDPDLDSCKWP